MSSVSVCCGRTLFDDSRSLSVKSITWTLGMFYRVVRTRKYLAHQWYRITVSWCKAQGVPVEKLFSKTLMTKCTSPGSSWSFCAHQHTQSRGRWRLTRTGSSDVIPTLLSSHSEASHTSTHASSDDTLDLLSSRCSSHIFLIAYTPRVFLVLVEVPVGEPVLVLAMYLVHYPFRDGIGYF